MYLLGKWNPYEIIKLKSEIIIWVISSQST